MNKNKNQIQCAGCGKWVPYPEEEFDTDLLCEVCTNEAPTSSIVDYTDVEYGE